MRIYKLFKKLKKLNIKIISVGHSKTTLIEDGTKKLVPFWTISFYFLDESEPIVSK